MRGSKATIREEIDILKSKGKSGSSVKTAVIKATRSELTAPKKKHVDYLITTTKGAKPNVHAILKGLRSRGTVKDWMVALKTLCVTHRLLLDADPSFAQACARTAVTEHQNFADVKDAEGVQQSEWIRIYSRYLEHKIKIIRKFNVQFEQMPLEMLDWDYDKLFPALKHMLVQLAYILEFESRLSMLTNPITKTSFSLILRDAVNLYGCLLKGFLRVSEEYREMSRTEVEDAADLYDRFIDYSERLVDKFFPKCKRYTNKIPDFDPAPEALLRELDDFARDQAPERAPEGRRMRILQARDNNPAYQKKKQGKEASSRDRRVKQVDARDSARQKGDRDSRRRDDDGFGDDRRDSRPRDDDHRDGGGRRRDDDGRRDRRERREKSSSSSSRRRHGSDVSFEDIPSDWLQGLDAAQAGGGGGGGGGGSRRSVSKDKDEYYYSDEVSRSDDEDQRDPFANFQGSSRNSQAGRASRNSGQQHQPPLSGGSSFQSQPPLSGGSSFHQSHPPLSGGGGFQQQPQQSYSAQAVFAQQSPSSNAAPSSYNSAGSFDPFAPTAAPMAASSSSSAGFGNSNFQTDPFAAARQPSASSSMSYGGSSGMDMNNNSNNRLSGHNMAAMSPSGYGSGGGSMNMPAGGYAGQLTMSYSAAAPYDPFAAGSSGSMSSGMGQQSMGQASYSNTMPVSGYPAGASGGGVTASYDPFSPSRLSVPQQPARSPFDPTLPAVPKSTEVGPNVLDSYQFDPFKVVNMGGQGSNSQSGHMDL